jgi:predicted RNase H-like HicB family nuclease
MILPQSEHKRRGYGMHMVKIVYWEDDGGWLGYLQASPDYLTQGETLEELK